jgi:hypothetical protein
VQHAEDAHGVPYNAIRHDVWRAGDDQRARAFNATGAATLGRPSQHLHSVTDPLIDGERSTEVVGFDIVEDRVAIRFDDAGDKKVMDAFVDRA